MILKINYKSRDWFNQPIECEDITEKGTLEHIKKAVKFIELKAEGSFFTIYPAGYDYETKYKYSEIRLKRIDGKLNIIIPPVVYEHGESEYIVCEDRDECFDKLKEMIKPL